MSRPSASTPGLKMSSTLWAHLLNKDAIATGSGLKTGLASVGLTASGPTDKAGTSIRILLHDTQATIEKFSRRVDTLVSEAEDSRQKLLARNEEVSGEVERLVRRAVQEQVGRTETTLRSSIGEPAQASALVELRQSISSSLDALNQKIEAVQNLAHINIQALQAVKDQQLQILTAIIPLLPTLQKVPLHIASAEANLKEEIRKSVVAPTIANIQPASAASFSGSRKRKLSESAEQHTPSPSVTQRRRIRIDPGRLTHDRPPSLCR
ncbi:hypothetical protein BDM02DRAFT_1941011 [Thelephora ganbajun]|uniref:Uncharacterized protein n=1 Tax=Thelephora ganbajun TaxID=370292 RepID=A0ACB6ZJ45_THEGA|nr:hypothetical protein BDM02DRAFT_1941011 [Thelephora ganbajun]